MYGIEAITAHNGWAQAVTGAIIVMLGLAILATVISFLPKLISLFEGNSTAPSPPPSHKEAEKKEVTFTDLSNSQFSTDIQEDAKKYSPLVQSLGDSFELGALHKILKEKHHPHPHLTIKTFREAGFILPVGDGNFTWNLDA